LVQYDEALALQEEGVQNASGKYSHAMRYPDMLKANWPLVPETNFYRENPDRDDIAVYKGKFIQLPWGDDKKSFGMDHILHNAIRQSNRRWEQVTDKDDENAILGIIDILNAKDLKVFKESPLDNKIIIRSGKFKRAIILGENKDDLRIISVVPSEIPKFGKIIDQTPDVKMSDKVLYQYKNNFTGIKVNFRFETPPATVTVKKTRSYELPKQSIAPKFSTARTVGATKRPYTPEQLKYFSETGRTIEIPTLRERIQALFKNFSSNLAQGIADQFDPLKKLDPMAYLLARMSKGSSGALESLLKYGKLKIRGGLLYDADRSGGFLENVVMPMKGSLKTSCGGWRQTGPVLCLGKIKRTCSHLTILLPVRHCKTVRLRSATSCPMAPQPPAVPICLKTLLISTMPSTAMFLTWQSSQVLSMEVPVMFGNRQCMSRSSVCQRIRRDSLDKVSRKAWLDRQLSRP
jgi:hypothetical protein